MFTVCVSISCVASMLLSVCNRHAGSKQVDNKVSEPNANGRILQYIAYI